MDSDAGKEGREEGRGGEGREGRMSALSRKSLPDSQAGERKGITSRQFEFLKYGGNKAHRS